MLVIGKRMWMRGCGGADQSRGHWMGDEGVLDFNSKCQSIITPTRPSNSPADYQNREKSSLFQKYTMTDTGLYMETRRDVDDKRHQIDV